MNEWNLEDTALLWCLYIIRTYLRCSAGFEWWLLINEMTVDAEMMSAMHDDDDGAFDNWHAYGLWSVIALALAPLWRFAWLCAPLLVAEKDLFVRYSAKMAGVRLDWWWARSAMLLSKKRTLCWHIPSQKMHDLNPVKTESEWEISTKGLGHVSVDIESSCASSRNY